MPTSSTVRSVVAFCMPEDGHFTLLAPMLSDLADRGVTVHLFTHARFAARVPEGVRFVDLFERCPLEALDDMSVPVPCRFVTYAAHYAERIAEEVRTLAPSAVIYETFSVIGRVVAMKLGIPYINVTVGHDLSPARYAAQLARDPRVAIGSACEHAVDVLRGWGIADASPFSYVTAKSPFLNVYPEPPQYLTDAAAFDPVVFYGSLPSRPRHCEPASHAGTRIYVAFGTIIWRYFADVAANVLTTIADLVACRDDLQAVIGLGGGGDDALVRRLERPNVRAGSFVDQWQALADADVFITHHGINSTHEAVFQRVPMLSYPFFWDQPVLAARCQALGFAIPLVTSPRAAIAKDRFDAALVAAQSSSVAARLEEARAWELAVIADRGRVLDDVIDRFVGESA